MEARAGLLEVKKKSRINSAEMKCFRRIAGKARRDSIRNERIREDLGQEGIENRLVKRQLKWYGHVVRMGEERKPKQFLEARSEGRRRRKSYEDGIEEIGRRKGNEEACCRPRKMEGVRRGLSNAVRHHGEEKEEDSNGPSNGKHKTRTP
jgi:hypothetical protein